MHFELDTLFYLGPTNNIPATVKKKVDTIGVLTVSIKNAKVSR